ncbi:hypothetical protein [Sphingobacterium bovistauri]|uniref:WG containing repeat-containing protein n=1 Tax=Sphingobacterium bovistauri TaxID=2781959 RepID=A0ABS7Z720_9SPHI|nr:hypothetical protein [Sphingobacterium bovistauri]MCA5005216.1 hypothetical protein [Sphingobacterium bovistauri]
MKNLILLSCLNLLFLTACGQKNTINIQTQKTVNWIPYLTKNGDYIYVDSNLKQQINTAYAGAYKFTLTGFTIVNNKDRKSAVIDTKGNIIVDYTEESIELEVFNQLTLMMKELEYEKKMPLWKWDWNIMGGDIKKTKTYKKIEISVLETQQVLLSKDVPYDEDNFYLNPNKMDENHLEMNDILYEIKDNKFKKIRSDIELSLDQKRYIPTSENQFEIYSIDAKKPLFSGLTGTDRIEISVNNKPFVLDSINQDRYAPPIPQLFQDLKTTAIFPYPQYDKAFPKEIKNATAEQINFMKDVSLVYSINNSPYFVLGRFNYDHSVWAYDWLYVDTAGNLLKNVSVKDFFIQDRVGYVVWPDKYMILSENELKKDQKIGKTSYVYQSGNQYITQTTKDDKKLKEGIWNADSKSWILSPENYTVEILDSERQIYALQKEKEGKFILYNNKTKQQIGTKSYDSIDGSGCVRYTSENKKQIYYYIDILTGKEYKE